MNKAQALYDSIGNEIFNDIADQLRIDTSVKEFKQGDSMGFAFDDGSSIIFKEGFALVIPEAENSQPVSNEKQFSEMSTLDRRLFSFGVYFVALFLVLFSPDATNRAVHQVLNKRLGKQ